MRMIQPPWVQKEQNNNAKALCHNAYQNTCDSKKQDNLLRKQHEHDDCRRTPNIINRIVWISTKDKEAWETLERYAETYKNA